MKQKQISIDEIILNCAFLYPLFHLKSYFGEQLTNHLLIKTATLVVKVFSKIVASLKEYYLTSSVICINVPGLPDVPVERT